MFDGCYFTWHQDVFFWWLILILSPYGLAITWNYTWRIIMKNHFVITEASVKTDDFRKSWTAPKTTINSGIQCMTYEFGKS